MINIAVIFGTRPEVIKMAPIVKELKKHKHIFNTIAIATSQHRDMIKYPIKLFDIKVDHDLDIMREKQDLFDISTNLLESIKGVYSEAKPDMVLVQGDTTTTFICALAAFYLKIPVAHVEAGLRTHDIYSPFPEEMNRKMVTNIAELHYAPTGLAEQNLINEGLDKQKIVVTGNSGIDAVMWVKNHVLEKNRKSYDEKYWWLKNYKKNILITTHRRENFGEPLRNILDAVKRIVENNHGVHVTFPVHLNPNVRDTVITELYGVERIKLIEPVAYDEFVYLLSNTYLILSDSGGIQEEAPAFGIPVIVLREKTERPEGVDAGTNILAGTDAAKIYTVANKLLNSRESYERVANIKNPFGDGTAAEKIVHSLIKRFQTN